MKANRKLKKTEDAAAGSVASVSGTHFMATLDLGLKLILCIAFMILTAIFFIFIYDFLTQYRGLAVENITVEGTHQLKRSAVIELSHVKTGDNLLKINMAVVRKRLEVHPWIHAARVSAQLPDTIRICITEEIPLARVDIGDSAHIIINRRGVPFAEYPLDNPDWGKDLPRVHGLALTGNEAGIGFHGPLFSKVMALLTGNSGQRLTAIWADTLTGIAVETALVALQPGIQPPPAPVILKLGFSRFGLKLERARAISRYVHDHGLGGPILTMDLYSPRRAVVTLDTGRKKTDAPAAKGV